MDPTTMRLMAAAATIPRVQVGTMTWAGTNDSSVTVTAGNTSYTTSGNANGDQTYGDAFPTINDTGLHLDVQLAQGYSSRVAWLGVCNATTAFNYSTSPRPYTGWYWSGDIWFPDSTDSTNASVLDAATYRIGLRTESSIVKFYIRKSGGAVRGPIDVPTGTLRLMMLGQVGFPLPEATILNSGAVYEGGGGLFS